MKLARPRFASTLLASVLLLAGTSAAQASDDPPGQQGRVTHQTLLETVESDCYEIPIPRAVKWIPARALVPERYEPLGIVAAEPATRLRMWDIVCNDFSVDGQRHAPTTQTSMAAIQLATRDGVPVVESYYLLYLNTDNPVLAARLRQLGLPAQFEPGLSSSVSDPSSTPYKVAFAVPGENTYTVSAVAATAPAPVPVSPANPFRLYHEGAAGEVVYSITNRELAAAPAMVTADYRQHPLLVSLIAQDRLLQINAPFAVGTARGSWTATVTHLN